MWICDGDGHGMTKLPHLSQPAGVLTKMEFGKYKTNVPDSSEFHNFGTFSDLLNSIFKDPQRARETSLFVLCRSVAVPGPGREKWL